MEYEQLKREVSSFLLTANVNLADALASPGISLRQVNDAIKALCQAKILLEQEEKQAA